jgi:hypothetical protein
MNLIDEIIAGVTQTKEPISDILRRCLVLAYKLKNDTLRVWVEKELNGYDSLDELPDYRRANGVAKGLFLGGWGSELRDQPLAPSVLKPEHQHFASEIRLFQPIASYENADSAKNPTISWPQDLVVRYQSSFYEGMALNRAWMEVPASLITGMVDIVRTRILTFALEIQDQLPDSQEQSVRQIPPAEVERIVQVTIYGGQNVFGNMNAFNAPVVMAGDLASLKASISALGVPHQDFAELEASLRDTGVPTTDDAQNRRLSDATLQWIAKAAKKVGSTSLKIGATVAEELLKRAVSGYLGL